MAKVTSLIGHTPIVKLENIVPEGSAQVYVKLESFNLGGSIKDRIAKHMVEVAEKSGALKPGKVIAEATSGNTGVGLALIGALKGYEVVIALPAAASEERKKLIKAYGATLIETPAADGIKGSFKAIEELAAKDDKYVPMHQFENLANPEIHRLTTGPEITEFFEGTPDIFVAGIGTGGTITGIGQHLRSVNPDVKIIAVEPKESNILNGGTPGKHVIQGIGAGVIPEVLDQKIYDEISDVLGEDARQTAKALGAKEGLLVGFSSGAAVYAAIEEAKKHGPETTILAIAPDNGERYLSTTLYD